MDIIKSIQESVAGWKMGFAYIAGKAGSRTTTSKSELGTAIVGPGYIAAQQRFAAIKAGSVSAQVPGEAAPVGVRYVPGRGSSVELPLPGYGPSDPGTPATVVESIQRSIGESAEGWRMGFASVAGKAKEAAAGVQASIERSVAGWQMGISETGGKITESFGNIGSGFQSIKWQMLLPVIILAFIAVMVAVGYSGLGAPAARVAEREYVRRR
jgi:hypothetical protein